MPRRMETNCLGAGKDIGRSCIVVTFPDRTRVMFDCGIHLGYQDENMYPLLSEVAMKEIACVFVSHFHLDHCGSLVYLTQVRKFSGPIYMTHPTKAIVPEMLTDMQRTGVLDCSEEDIEATMEQVIGIDVYSEIRVQNKPGLVIQAIPAGHTLGAVMVRVFSEDTQTSVIYSGDFNSCPERHLNAAAPIPTHWRESEVAETLRNGGKVLVPVYAFGRYQELCHLLQSLLDRENLQHVPVYCSNAITQRTKVYYNAFLNWCSSDIRHKIIASEGLPRSPFEVSNVKQWNRDAEAGDGPCVLFATPGLLQGGQSKEAFISWAPERKNLLLFPGYCPANSLGRKLLEGLVKHVNDGNRKVMIKCQIEHFSASEHADQRGIMALIRHCKPKSVVLVHGEASNMQSFQTKVNAEFKIPCDVPDTGSKVIHMLAAPDLHIKLDYEIYKNIMKRGDSGADVVFTRVENSWNTPRYLGRLGEKRS